MVDKPNHGPDEPNPPGPKPPALMQDDELKRCFRNCMRDIGDGRVEYVGDEVTPASEELIARTVEAERALRNRGYEPESVASDELLGRDYSGADE